MSDCASKAEDVTMKILSVFTIVAIAIFFGYSTGSADRLYHWVDKAGISHLSKEPPPEDGMLKEVMEYSVRTDKPVKPDIVESGKKPETENRSVSVEKLQETYKQPEPEDDLAQACYMHATMGDVYIYVFEFASPDSVIEMKLYKGTVPKGRKQLIRSSTGKIEFSYQRSLGDRTYGANKANCAAGNVISVQ
jgi:hypothetical protein